MKEDLSFNLIWSAMGSRTFQEAERRSRQVEHLESQKIQLHKVFIDRRGVKLSGALGLPPPLLGYMPPQAVSRTLHFDKPCSRETEVLGTGRVGLKSWLAILLFPTLLPHKYTASEMLRSNLMQRPGPVFADMGTTGWGTDEPEDDRTQSEQHMSVNELRQHQQRMVKDQNEGLEILSKVISRQKEIAQTIGNEVDIQNVVTIMLSCRHRVQQGHKITWILTTTDIGAGTDTDIIEIIEDLADHMDRTDTRLLDETKQIKIIDKKDRTCWYWVTIILLFITIVIVGVV
uniref:t-SNARE coiled-coil homology domain-containing protein n=1 Tax=Timema bartmani TaxID=61472 RepID=A0A7R9F750_9NEOP|nr:unnamed protein product [Timema bartmani]